MGYQEIGALPATLDAAAEADLARRISGATFGTRDSAEAEEELVRRNLTLAKKLGREYGRRIGAEDAFGIAQLGLLLAARAFRPEMGRFTTFAARVIRNEIQKLSGEYVPAVRLPPHASIKLSKLLRGKPVPMATPAQRRLAEAILAASRSIRYGESEAAGGPRAGDVPRRGPAGLDADAAEALALAVARLSPRHREVLARRFGLEGRERETLAEVGRSLGLTRERVRQVEADALAELRTDPYLDAAFEF